MNIHHKYLQYLQQEFEKFNLKFSQNKSGREGIDFRIKTNSANLHEIYLQPII